MAESLIERLRRDRIEEAKRLSQQYPIKKMPIYIMNEQGVGNLEKRAVIDGAREMTLIIGTEQPIIDYGVWRMPNFRDPDGSLKEFYSVDWYIQKGKEASRNKVQLNVMPILYNLGAEPWRDPKKGGIPHFDILVSNTDLYYDNNNFVIGCAYNSSIVISPERFKWVGEKEKYECIKTQTMHELGHIFGLIPYDRKENVENSLGLHCTNRCVMRQGLRVPDDWIRISEDRLKYRAFCPTCIQDLKNYFK